MGTVYCPYSDADLEPAETTTEHIIPKSLGGHDALVLRVGRMANAQLGSSVDGAIANDFFVSRRRAQHDARGHSGKDPVFVVKNARESESGKPLQLRWGKRLEVYDPIERAPSKGPKKVEGRFTVDPDIRLRFLAKSFVSAGYFSYGDVFRFDVEHAEARLLMQPWGSIQDAQVRTIRTRAYTWLQNDVDDRQQEELNVQRAICSQVQGSILVLAPGPRNLGFFGSVLGEYLGFLNVPADTSRFPRRGDYDLGHALIVSGGNLLRWSYRRLLGRILAEFARREGS